MDRRESLKTMLIGALGTGAVLTGCVPRKEDREKLQDVYDFSSYGRTIEEKQRDADLFGENFLTDHELETVAVMCDLILPATKTAGSASDAHVPAFIDFMVKDAPSWQDRFRNGIIWMDGYSKQKFGYDFVLLTKEQQIEIFDEIAYPDNATEENQPGVDFFRDIRNLTLTGYYTTQMGFDDLGYVGNRPNIWDGVPDEVLKEHGLAYEPEWLAKCVDQSKREVTAEWDEDGNLIS
ncbi:MAG: gluconate 2-dehydrogenase subunit 3 family protein [Balneolaceae bacterium]|nr:gluconate 2-dehydrogenase subunit 3 family protein [Balneolaceae bacterium]